MPIRCEIVSQDRVVGEGEADMVVLPGTSGEMGILPNHAPLLSTLRVGIIKSARAGLKSILPFQAGLSKFSRIL